MSVDGSEQKVAILHAVGSRLDDQLEAAQSERFRCEGAVAGIEQTWEKMQGLLGHVDKDVDGGELDLEQAALAKKQITRCMNLVEHMRTMAQSRLLQARGAVSQADKTVKMLKSEYDAAASRVETEKQGATAAGPDGQINREGRPAPSLKERRLAEADIGAPNAQCPDQVDASKQSRGDPRARSEVIPDAPDA